MLFKSFVKQYRGLIYFIILAVILTFLVSLILPRAYESESVIQIGNIEPEPEPNVFIRPESYSLAESKNIILGSSVLSPIKDQFYPKKDIDLKRFIKKNIKVDIISERGPAAELLKTNYIRITTSAKTPKAALEMNQKVISYFFNYTLKEHNAKIGLIENEISLREARISEMEGQLDKLTKGALQGSEGAANSGISSKSQLVGEYLKAISLEQSELYKLKERLSMKKDYAVISEPQLPLRHYRPNIFLNAAAALALSILISGFIILHDFLSKEN